MESKESEIICRCKYVSASEIKKTLKQGAYTVEQVIQYTGAGTGCGRCKPQIAAMVNKHNSKKKIIQLKLPF